MGLCTLYCSYHRLAYLLLIDLLYTLVLPLYFYPLCLHSILYTKTAFSRIYISYLHAYQISAMYFYLLYNLLLLQHLFLAEYLLTCVYDPDITLLQLLLYLFCFIFLLLKNNLKYVIIKKKRSLIIWGPKKKKNNL